MKIGVDSSLIVAGVHANHPHHALAVNWLIRNIDDHQLLVAHHSVLESYAVLTRLPGSLRVTPSEARDLLQATVRANMELASFEAERIWGSLEFMAMSSVLGGQSYDAFILRILEESGAEAVATMNPAHFIDLVKNVRILDPTKPGP